MQDKYVGDVGDYGKYGLLNKLHKCSNGTCTIGVNWYYATRDEKRRGDGRYTQYLVKGGRQAYAYANCFPGLYRKLKAIVDGDKRQIREIEERQVLPKNTVFYREPLPFSATNPDDKERKREDWFNKSLKHLSKADIVFVDPDNGIQTETVKKTQVRAIKYVFWDEIERYHRQGKSMIVYNHRDRKPEAEYNAKIMSITRHVPSCRDMRVVRFRRVSIRDFVFLVQPRHRRIFDTAIKEITQGPCSFLFTRYPLNVSK